MNKIIICIGCGKKLTGKQTKFCGAKCKSHFHQCYPLQKIRGIKRKLQFVQSFGGQCSVCGYQKNLSALTFHHTKPARKGFQIDVRAFSNRTIERISVELKKCILLCNNCHAELHNPDLDLKSQALGKLLG